MTDKADSARQRDEFLARLDAAMREVPHGVATEIRAGITEEFAGLDAASTAQRIAQLGDPTRIAEEAQAESRPPRTSAAERKGSVSHRRAYSITAAFVFAFGGFVVPVVGWAVGAVMVASSALWRRWEKVVAIALPFAMVAVVLVASWIVGLVSSSGTPAEQEHNPLVPTGLDLWHSGIIFVFILMPVTGAWLLWRLRRR